MRHWKWAFAILLGTAVSNHAQETAPATNAGAVTVTPGTHIPLSLINSVGTKHSAEGDRVYMQTVFPILVDGKIIIPPGSYVEGTVTHLKRPGRVKGRGELFLRFDSLTLPNGVVRDFHGRLSAVDARGDETLNKSEGMVKGDGNVGGDVRTVAEAASVGASIGAIAGAAEHSVGTGIGAGAGAGLAAGLLGVLLTRGPDATLAQGSTIELVLDRPLTFQPGELNFGPVPAARFADGPGPAQKNANPARSRFPF
jgi:type IV secretion system protein VirB10